MSCTQLPVIEMFCLKPFQITMPRSGALPLPMFATSSSAIVTPSMPPTAAKWMPPRPVAQLQGAEVAAQRRAGVAAGAVHAAARPRADGEEVLDREQSFELPVTPAASVMPEPVRPEPSTIDAMPWPRSVTAS